MSIRVLAIGDNHFEPSNLVDVDQFLIQVEKAARRLEPDCIVLLGDLLHDHERAHMDAHVRAVRLLKTLTKYALTFFVIGNHDRRNNSDFQSDHHFFTGIEIPNLIIVERALKYCVPSRKNPEVVGNFLFVPYVAPGKFYEALDTIVLEEFGEDTWRSPQIDCIFAHQEFKGVQLGPRKSEVGDFWDETWPLVVSGHIHEYQLLQHNLLYPGTPIQQTFQEKPDKAIILLDFNTCVSELATTMIAEVQKLEELVPDPLIKTRYARVHLGLRQKKTVKLHVSQLATFKPDLRDHTKLVVRGTTSELRALTKSKSLDKHYAVGVKVSFDPYDEKVTVVTKKTTDPTVSVGNKSFLQLFRDLLLQDKELLSAFDQLFRE